MDTDILQELESEFSGFSWAIWSDDFPDDGCVEEDVAELRDYIYSRIEKLNPSVVLLGLNKSGEETPSYKNFHSPSSRHNDDRLKEFIQDNNLERISGAYMTDLVADVVEADSSNVDTEDTDVERFFTELSVLNENRFDIIAFGNDSFNGLKHYFGAVPDDMEHNIKFFSESPNDYTVNVYRVWHYSNRWNPNLIEELEDQLKYLDGTIVG